MKKLLVLLLIVPVLALAQPKQKPGVTYDAARSAAIPTPATGMMIFVQNGTSPFAVYALQVYNGTAWINV